MQNSFSAVASSIINAPKAKVWEALTNPSVIKQYLFGTEVHTDWKEGSPITYTGEWEGKQYEDKGKILKNEPEKKLISTYWSSMSSEADTPENYQTVTYELSEEGDATKLTITQENTKSKESAEHSKKNWEKVLENMKNILEK